MRWPRDGRRYRRWVGRGGGAAVAAFGGIPRSLRAAALQAGWRTAAATLALAPHPGAWLPHFPPQPQVKAQYDSLLEEMAAARRERERWQEQQAAAERQLASERERFEGFAKTQVGRRGLAVML